MESFFNPENNFFQGVNKGIDCICLNLLWLLCCLPLLAVAYVAYVTKALLIILLLLPASAPAGAATTALYYAVQKTIRHGRSYIWREFWASFRGNFKQAAAVSAVFSALILLLGLDMWIMRGLAETGQGFGMVYVIFFIFIILVILWANYAYAYLARFSNGTKAILKNGALMAIAHLPMTGMLLVAWAVTSALVLAVPPLILVIPSCYMLLEGMILEKVFRKYMSPEDIAAEEERNQE